MSAIITRDALRVYVTTICLSVRLFVCPSRSCFVSKRLNGLSWFFYNIDILSCRAFYCKEIRVLHLKLLRQMPKL